LVLKIQENLCTFLAKKQNLNIPVKVSLAEPILSSKKEDVDNS
jgi:hypothetical protein